MVGFYFGFALSFDFGRGEKGVGGERILSERGEEVDFSLVIYIYINCGKC